MFGVTPEFQKYIAKQLSLILDKKLEKLSKSTNSNEKSFEKHNKGGIKLLSSSNSFLEIDCESNSNINTSTKIKRTAAKPYIKKEEYKNLIISGEAVLAKEEIKYWSTRTKGKIFRYSKDAKGQLVLKE